MEILITQLISFQKKIVGGTETLVNEFPMMAGVVDVASGAGIFCGGTISKYIVVIEIDISPHFSVYVFV